MCVLSHRAEACERNSFVWSSRYDGIVTVRVAAPHFQKFNSLEAMCVTRVDVAGKRLLVVPRRDDLLLAFNLLYLKKQQQEPKKAAATMTTILTLWKEHC